MKSPRSLFVIFSIFLLIEGTISSDIKDTASLKEIFVPRRGISDPLAVIKKRESPSWELAVPHSTDNVEVAGYYYDEKEDENGQTDHFYIACPAYGEWGENFEKKWRETDSSYKESQLFTLVEYEGANMVCKEKAKPSIKKLKLTDEMNNPMYCGKSEAEIYEVGYPVLVSKDGPTAEFMSIYKICHSKAKGIGTLYTIQHIVSPDLLLLEKRLWYEPKISQVFKSYLDKNLRRVQKFYTKNFIYRFAGPYFMPARIWERTTLFPFNFTPVKSRSIFHGLLRADRFIQVFSKTTNTPLTLYSGTYETTVPITSTMMCGVLKCSKNVPVKLFWRILVDSRDHAIIIVTQLTQLRCSLTIEILCRDKNGRSILETYSIDSCMYKCPVTDTMIETLGLPATQLGLNIKGVLSLRVPKSPKNQVTGGSSDAQAESETEYSDMGDFMGNNVAFVAAVAAVDASLASIIETDAGYVADGQGHGDGYAFNDGNGVVGGDGGGAGEGCGFGGGEGGCGGEGAVGD